MAMKPIKRGAGTRLAQAREAMGYTQKQLHELAEIPLPTLKDYEGGNSIPGGEALAKLAFIGFNLEYVFWGEGEPLTRGLARQHSPQSALGEPPARYGAGAPYVNLPLYQLSAGAAPRGKVIPAAENPVSELAFREDWIRNTLHTTPDKLTLIHVEGDSMDPDLRAGDIILVDHTDTTARREGIYVLRMDDALLVKMVQRLPGGIIKLISRNDAYEPIMLPVPKLDPGGEVAIIGRVVWSCRRM